MFRVIGGAVVYGFACYGFLTFLGCHVRSRDPEQ
jgi:hypothetical protein